MLLINVKKGINRFVKAKPLPLPPPSSTNTYIHTPTSDILKICAILVIAIQPMHKRVNATNTWKDELKTKVMSNPFNNFFYVSHFHFIFIFLHSSVDVLLSVLHLNTNLLLFVKVFSVAANNYIIYSRGDANPHIVMDTHRLVTFCRIF